MLTRKIPRNFDLQCEQLHEENYVGWIKTEEGDQSSFTTIATRLLAPPNKGAATALNTKLTLVGPQSRGEGKSTLHQIHLSASPSFRFKALLLVPQQQPSGARMILRTSNNTVLQLLRSQNGRPKIVVALHHSSVEPVPLPTLYPPARQRKKRSRTMGKTQPSTTTPCRQHHFERCRRPSDTQQQRNSIA